jgi:tryptophan-rich sensory protein
VDRNWYDSLVKPSWTPEPGIIGTIWTILYPVILVVYGWALFKMVRGEIPWVVAMPIGINLAANFAFTPIQFGLQNLPLATIDIIIVLVTIVWSMIALWPYSRLAVVALVPYLLWVGTATVLQTSITWLNR